MSQKELAAIFANSRRSIFVSSSFFHFQRFPNKASLVPMCIVLLRWQVFAAAARKLLLSSHIMGGCTGDLLTMAISSANVSKIVWDQTRCCLQSSHWAGLQIECSFELMTLLASVVPPWLVTVPTEQFVRCNRKENKLT